MEQQTALANGEDHVEAELIGGEADVFEAIGAPPTANFVTGVAAHLLKGLRTGKVTYQAAMGGARLVDAIAKVHGNKLRAATYQSKPLHKDLLKELSVKI